MSSSSGDPKRLFADRESRFITVLIGIFHGAAGCQQHAYTMYCSGKTLALLEPRRKIRLNFFAILTDIL